MKTQLEATVTRARPRRVAAAPLAILVTIVVAAAALRLIRLGWQPYWYDEADTLGVLRMNFWRMFPAIAHGEATPPLYFTLAWLWTHAFGTGEWALRLLSAACGVAAVPVTYAAGLTLSTRRIALVAAALVATSPLLVDYSQEARSYSLLVLCAALSVWALAAALAEPSRKRLWLWALAASVSLCAHYYALFVIAPEAALIVWRARKRTIAPFTLVAITGFALLPLALKQSGAGSWIAISDPLGRRATSVLQEIALNDHSIFRPYDALAIAAPLLIGALTFALASASERRAARAMAVIVAAGLVVPFVLALCGRDYVLSRNLIAVTIPLALCAAVGFGSRNAHRVGIIAAACLCALAIATVLTAQFAPDRQRRVQWRDVAAQLGESPSPRALIVDYFASNQLALYRPELRTMPPGELPVSEVDEITTDGRGHPQIKRAVGERVVSARALVAGNDFETLHRVALYEPRARYSAKPQASGATICGEPLELTRATIRAPCAQAYITR